LKREIFENPYLLTIFSFVLFSIGSFYVSFFPPDEPKYVDAALRMIEHSNYIVPFFNCHVRFDKPILYYWELVVFFKLFGVDQLLKTGHDPLGIIEYAARLPSIIAGSLIVLFTYLTSFELFKNRKAAADSAIALLTFFFYFYLTRAVYPDASLILFELVAIYLFIRRRYIVAWLFVALAFLTKGPIGIVTPGFTYFIYLWVVERKSGLKEFFSLPNLLGFLLFIAVSAPWYVAMYHIYGYEFVNRFLIYHNIERFTGAAHQHPHSFFYYLPIIAACFYMWYPYAGDLIKRITFKDNKNLFLFLWFLWIVLFFSISRNKLAHYIAPAFIPIAILFGRYLSELKNGKTGAVIMCIIELVAAIGIAIYLYSDGLATLSTIALFGLIAAAATNFFKRPYQTLVMKVVVLSIAAAVLLTEFDAIRPEKRIWHTLLNRPYPLYEYRINNQSIVAYTRRCLTEIKDPNYFDSLAAPFYIYTKTKHLKELKVHYRILFRAQDKGAKTALLFVP